ncbi:MAG: GTP cyclohydrolase I [Acidimicrobiales bacterium]
MTALHTASRTEAPRPSLVAVAAPAAPTIDHAAARAAVRSLLGALGQNVDDPELLHTPRRVVDAFEELLSPTPFELTTFANTEDYDELVIVRDIPVRSLCAHHLLPFTGVAHVGYLPDGRILGLSKLARAIEGFARGLQVQERLTSQVGAWLDQHLMPKGVGVVIEAEHLCMTIRGVQARGTRTITSSLHGLVRHDARTRAEFLALAGLRA